MRLISAFFLCFLLMSCGKNEQTVQPGYAEDKIIRRSSKVYLRDKTTDISLFHTGAVNQYGEYRFIADSLVIFASDDNIEFWKANDMIYISESQAPYHVDLTYLNDFVSKETTIQDFRFNMYLAFRWNYLETDSLNIRKDNANEIVFYKNGEYYKTINADDRTVPEITFYR